MKEFILSMLKFIHDEFGPESSLELQLTDENELIVKVRFKEKDGVRSIATPVSFFELYRSDDYLIRFEITFKNHIRNMKNNDI